MTYYYINIFWKDEWSPVYITTNEEEAKTLLEQLKKSWSKNAADYNVDIDGGIRLESKEITSSLIYDYDWFDG